MDDCAKGRSIPSDEMRKLRIKAEMQNKFGGNLHVNFKNVGPYF